METICAPSYANSLIEKFESTYIYLYIREKIITCLRYIDHLFFIWKGIEKKLLSFIEDLDRKHSSIKFNLKDSKTE